MAAAGRAGGRGPARSARIGWRSAASIARTSASCVRVTSAATDAAIAPIRPMTGSASGYSGPSSAPTPGACPWMIACSTFSWITKPMATTADQSQPGDDEPPRERSSGVATCAKGGCASPKAAHPEPDRDPGDERDRSQREARPTPVAVSGSPQGGGELLARTDLDEVDRVVRDEQRQSRQRPEGQPVAEIGAERRKSHVNSYGTGHAPHAEIRPTRRGRGRARRGASATRGAAVGRDRARTRRCRG